MDEGRPVWKDFLTSLILKYTDPIRQAKVNPSLETNKQDLSNNGLTANLVNIIAVKLYAFLIQILFKRVFNFKF